MNNIDDGDKGKKLILLKQQRKELREKTGAGFLDCKNALSENDNDIEQSIDSLRKKGLAKASKKSSREANEGAIGFYNNENISVILKINSETDFSAKSDTFLDFLDSIGNIVLNTNNKNLNISDLLKVQDNGKNISDLLTEMIAKIGENLIINDLKVFDKRTGKMFVRSRDFVTEYDIINGYYRVRTYSLYEEQINQTND